MSKANNKYPIFLKGMISCLIFTVFSFVLISRSNKPKETFYKITGILSYLEETHKNVRLKNDGRRRFLQIHNSPMIFDLFVGKNKGDFKPSIEQIDSLKLGDEITIFYDHNGIFADRSNQNINKLVQFIEKDQKLYFKRGSKDKYGGYFFIGITLILIPLLIYLKKIKRIE